MRRQTGADEQHWADTDECPDGAFTLKRSSEREAEHAAFQARCLQLERLQATWSSAIQCYLDVLGQRTWGTGQYELDVAEDPNAYWREYQVKEREWHERTDRYQVRNQDDWYGCEYRLGYRLRIKVEGDRYLLGNTPLSEDSLRQWFCEVCENCLQSVEEHLIRIY